MTRERFPNRRMSTTMDFSFGQVGFCVSFSLLDAEAFRVGEIFMMTAKTSTPREAEVRDAMILASFALQHGASLDELCKAMTCDHAHAATSAAGAALKVVAKAIEDMKRDA